MCSLNFKHYCLLCQYDNIYVGDDIKCKSIEIFLYHLYIVVTCKYICGAFSGQELLTCQSDKESWINESSQVTFIYIAFFNNTDCQSNFPISK